MRVATTTCRHDLLVLFGERRGRNTALRTRSLANDMVQGRFGSIQYFRVTKKIAFHNSEFWSYEVILLTCRYQCSIFTVDPTEPYTDTTRKDTDCALFHGIIIDRRERERIHSPL